MTTTQQKTDLAHLQPSEMVAFPDRDALGDLLLDMHKIGPAPRRITYFHERLDGVLTPRDAFHYFAPIQHWRAGDQEAMDRLNGKVLDIGCGAGRAMFEASSRGFEVEGIEQSPGAVSVCRSYNLPVHHGTLDDPGPLGVFDTLLLLDNGLGVLEDLERAPTVLQALARLASPGARILATSQDPSYLAQDPDHRALQEKNVRWGRMHGHTISRLRYRRSGTPWLSRLRLGPDELARLLSGSRWRLHSYTSPDTHGCYLAELHLVGARPAPGNPAAAFTGIPTTAPRAAS